MNILSNVNLKKILEVMSVYIHNQCVRIRKDFVIPDGELRLYSDYAIYPTDKNDYYAFHYVVHVDNQTERFFIVTWTPSTEDEYLDSIDY